MIFNFLFNCLSKFNIIFKEGYTALLIAISAKSGNIDVVKLLIEHKAEINAQTNVNIFDYSIKLLFFVI